MQLHNEEEAAIFCQQEMIRFLLLKHKLKKRTHHPHYSLSNLVL